MQRSTSVLLAALMIILASSVSTVNLLAQRPKVREVNEKKMELAAEGVKPQERNEKWGYVGIDGKFIIKPVFKEVMQMTEKQVSFVSYPNELEEIVWTPINIKGVYLTDLEFKNVNQNFDSDGLAIVQSHNWCYGMIDHTGKTVVDYLYKDYLKIEPGYLFRHEKYKEWINDCLLVIKDNTENGYSTYCFKEGEPIIAQSRSGFGVISPKTHKVVADFSYDTITEWVRNSVYCLQKGDKQFLYADDVLSQGYDDIIPSSNNDYFVIMRNGLYGILSSTNKYLLSCNQSEMPVLHKNEYTRFYESGVPVYVKVDKRISATEYDEYLFKKHQEDPAGYILDTTLDSDKKKHIDTAVKMAYGTPGFARISHLPQAVKYAEGRKLILLSSNSQPARFLDLNTRTIIDAGEVLYHSFPSRTGAPAFASAYRNGKFGMINITNRQEVLPFEYDKIVPLGNGQAHLYKEDSLYLYNVYDSSVISVENKVSSSLTSIRIKETDGYNYEYRYVDLDEYRNILPENHTLENLTVLPSDDSLSINMGAFMKKGDKGAIFSLYTGERLTEYSFDKVDDILLGGKYHRICVNGKTGLYDMRTKTLVMQCSYDYISKYSEHDGDEWVVIFNQNKYGLYNITQQRLAIPAEYDDIVFKDGYAALKRGEKYAAYSVYDQHMIFPSPVDEIQLLANGFAIVANDDLFYIYNLKQDMVHINLKGYEEECRYNPIVELSDELIFIPEHGILNCRYRMWETRSGLDWAYYADRIGDYINLRGGFEIESQAIYSIERESIIMSYTPTYKMQPISDRYLKNDYILFHSYASEYGNAKEEIGIYNIDERKWLFKDAGQIDYIGHGLLKVENNDKTKIVDLSTNKTLLEVPGRLREYEGLQNLYLTEYDSPEHTYMFDDKTKEFIPFDEHFTKADYKAIEAIGKYSSDCEVIRSGDKWEIYVRTDNDFRFEKVPYKFDRISQLFE